MLESIKVTWYQACETFAESGLKGILRPRFFWKQVATPVEMDLINNSFSQDKILQECSYRLIEFRLEDLHAEKWTFLTPSRRLKALSNVKRGWRGFAMCNENQVIGDIWCVTPRDNSHPVSHDDLKMLGITPGIRDAYAFDMQIAPEFRGKHLAIFLQRFIFSKLKAEGFQRLYGYYWNKNLPALRMHRILKYKELPKREVSRFLWLVKVYDPW